MEEFTPVPGDPELLWAAARGLRDVAAELAARRTTLTAQTERAVAGWVGPRSLELRFAAAGVRLSVERSADAVSGTAGAITDLAAMLEQVQEEVGARARQAAAARRTAEHRATALPPGDPQAAQAHAEGLREQTHCADQAEAARADLLRAQQRCAARVAELTDRAPALLGDPQDRLGGRRVGAVVGGAGAWGLLARWLDAGAGAGPVSPRVLAELVGTRTSAQAARWWRGLDAAQQLRLLRTSPDLLGNRDGLPGWARDLANRQRISTVAAGLAQQIAVVHHGLRGAALVSPAGALLGIRVAGLLTDKLRALSTLAKVLRRPDRRLLLLAAGGEQLHAAVAVGDVDTADDVGVFTPGLRTTVQDSLPAYDDDAAGLVSRASDVQTSVGRPRSTAAVAWLGYDAPQLDELANPLRSVASSRLARAGGVSLAGFLTGLDRSREGRVHLVAIGHSYGSSTTGYALRTPGTGVDDVVLFGSPGDSVHTPEDLHVPPGHLWCLAAREDPVAAVPRFGELPPLTRGYRLLDTGDATGPGGLPLRGVTGHTHYLEPGTTSQWNIAAVLAGAPSRVLESPGLVGAGVPLPPFLDVPLLEPTGG